MKNNQQEQVWELVARSVSGYLDEELPAGLPYQQLYEELNKRILYLLRHRQERLMQALYRVDVPEQQVRQAFGASSAEEIASALAVLVLEREAAKVKWRQMYSENSQER